MELKFAKEEKVLCFHGPLLYEAKVLKAEFWDAATYGPEEGPHFFVHYKGWKQTWDEWVPESRILKLDEENLERQRDLQSSYSNKRDERLPVKKADGTSNSAALANSSSKKRPRDGATDKEEDFTKRQEIRIPLPDSLKAQLVDDWENITRSQRLVSLPRTPTVTDLLEDYKHQRLKSKSKEQKLTEETLNEVIDGLKLYFDRALGTILLYRHERPQYAEVVKRFPNTRLCDIYGAEHLLRLFVQLPLLAAHTTMDHETTSLLKEQLHFIILYIQKSAGKLFLAEYENAPPYLA